MWGHRKNRKENLQGKQEKLKAYRILLMEDRQLFWILPLKKIMKIITWNIRGMNSIHKLDIVHNFVRDQKPDIFLFKRQRWIRKELKILNPQGLQFKG